jgi:putative ABC transport system permease protein
MMSLTWRWFWRSTQRREYLWLWLAVILSSASVTLISQVSQSVRATMVAETVNSMGAQLLLRSTQPIDRHWAEQAAKAEIMVGELIQLNTMIVSVTFIL